MVLMKIITLLAANPSKGRDCLCLNSSFYCSAVNQAHFQMPCGGEAGFS